MIRIFLLIIGYVCGLFTTGYVIAKLEHKDIRHEGSGNIGATNSVRVLGVKMGALVLLGDLLKALIPMLIVKHIYAGNEQAAVYAAYIGFGAVLGHDFPFYLNWNGGKGVSSTAGFFLGMGPRTGLTLIIPFLVMFFLFRKVSICSLVGVALAAITACMLYPQTEIRVITIIIAVLCIWRHKGNIERLLNGTESKLELGKGDHKS